MLQNAFVSFAGSITTNSIDISIHLRRPLRTKSINEPSIEKIKSQFLKGEYENVCGINPGLRYKIGMVKLGSGTNGDGDGSVTNT
jgi:hypothetical protein